MMCWMSKGCRGVVWLHVCGGVYCGFYFCWFDGVDVGSD